MSEFVGFHREELLARFANCELNLACSEFRQLCAHVSALLFQLNFTFKDCKQHYVYTRWTPGYGRNERATGKILRQCFTMWPDSNGNICHMKRTMVTISEEEYDRVAKVVPQSCDPLASAVVGRKSAAELNSREILEEESFAAMAASETGRAQLHLLANILEGQFAPIVQKARIILAP